MSAARWEHLHHGADIGVRGIGPTPEAAFAQAALALSAVITDPGRVRPDVPVNIRLEAPDLEVLLVDWLNALIFEMSARNMLFGRFDVDVRPSDAGFVLEATAWGEPVDCERHRPAVEVKGATFTELEVRKSPDGWLAQCVVDV